jgi:hypothetical protein
MIHKQAGTIIMLSLLSLCMLWAAAFGGDNYCRVRDITVLQNLPPRKRVVSTPFPGTQSDQRSVLPLLVDGVYDTLIFDDGEPVSAYYWSPGCRMAARMSPDTAQAESKIIAVVFYHWIPGAFFPGIYAWSGSSPADTLLQWNDTSTVAGFNTFMVDTAEIIVQGDFVVSHGVVDTITALGYDNYNNGRAWDFNAGSGTWGPYLETYFIRAIVEYPPYGAVPPNLDVLVPTAVSLDPPYPNPFNPTTNFVIRLDHSGQVSLKIYDLLGREVATLLDGFHPGGTVKVSWDAGRSSSGIYWAVLSDRSDRVIRKLVLLK